MAQLQASGSSRRAEATPPQGPLPHPWDGFLTGAENELAFAGAQALARGERAGISPLVVHGPSGVGKSRLLAGLAAEWLRRHPQATIAHGNAADFADGCVEAARNNESGGWSELRAHYRSAGLLVLDDLENLERAPLAHNELLYTLDALDATGAAVAVSCHAPPGQWPRAAWPARLVNRLLGGLVVRIEPPGLVSRRRYILEQARARGLSLSAEATESLAATADGYRTLHGWLSRLTLQSKVELQPGRRSSKNHPASSPTTLDLTTVATILREETELATTRLTVDQITRAVAKRFGVRMSALRGPGRQASVVEARHLAMHLVRLHTGLSFAAIGAHFGGRDPATVRHACKATLGRLSADPALAAIADSFSQHSR